MSASAAATLVKEQPLLVVNVRVRDIEEELITLVSQEEYISFKDNELVKNRICKKLGLETNADIIEVMEVQKH